MAENTIDFSRNENLKAVYDSGLRPWRVRSDEISNLLITDQRVCVIVTNGGSFVMDVEIGDFGVLAGNQLSSADFISQPMPLKDAIAQIRDICRSLGIPLASGEDGRLKFEEKARELTTLGNQAPSPQGWSGYAQNNGISYSVTLTPLFGLNNLSKLRGKVDVTLQFADPGKR